MIKTITERTPEDLDNAVNKFEAECKYLTGVSRVFATQTHVTVTPDSVLYTAIIFYKPEVKV